jgi:hypothetical protein
MVATSTAIASLSHRGQDILLSETIAMLRRMYENWLAGETQWYTPP